MIREHWNNFLACHLPVWKRSNSLLVSVTNFFASFDARVSEVVRVHQAVISMLPYTLYIRIGERLRSIKTNWASSSISMRYPFSDLFLKGDLIWATALEIITQKLNLRSICFRSHVTGNAMMSYPFLVPSMLLRRGMRNIHGMLT